MPLGAILILLAATFCGILLGMQFWWALRRRHAREQAAYELQLRLVQSAGANLTELLQSEAGRTLLPLLQPREAPGERMRAQILQSARWGAVVLCASLALFASAAFVPVSRGGLVAGALAGAGAIGLLLSAFVTARIARATE